MARVAVFVHPERDEARVLADDAISWLERRGHEVCVDHLAQQDGHGPDASPVHECSLDLALSLGGDGTMLRTVEVVADEGVPILGVNVGHRGYLTVVEPDGLVEALERFFDGRYEIERRMTLRVRVEGPAPNATERAATALNDAVVEKTQPGNTIRVRMFIGDDPFMTYAADALLVATSTGSTAYNLSARGPIVAPDVDALVVTPVSPHMLFDRSLVLSHHQTVRLEVLDGRSAALVVDGRELGEVGQGDTIVCCAGPEPAQLVTFGRRHFHRILKAKFGLAEDQ